MKTKWLFCFVLFLKLSTSVLAVTVTSPSSWLGFVCFGLDSPLPLEAVTSQSTGFGLGKWGGLFKYKGQTAGQLRPFHCAIQLLGVFWSLNVLALSGPICLTAVSCALVLTVGLFLMHQDSWGGRQERLSACRLLDPNFKMSNSVALAKAQESASLACSQVMLGPLIQKAHFELHCLVPFLFFL